MKLPAAFLSFDGSTFPSHLSQERDCVWLQEAKDDKVRRKEKSPLEKSMKTSAFEVRSNEVHK